MKHLRLWRLAVLAVVVAAGLAMSGLGHADAAPNSERKITSAKCMLTAAPGELVTLVPPIVEIGWQNQFVSDVVIKLYDGTGAVISTKSETLNLRSGFKKYSFGVAGADPAELGVVQAEIQLLDNRAKVRTVVVRSCQ